MVGGFWGWVGVSVVEGFVVMWWLVGERGTLCPHLDLDRHVDR